MREAPSAVKCTQTASRRWARGAGRRRRTDGVFHGDRASVREDESSGAGAGVVAPRRECTSRHCTMHAKAVKTVHVTLYIFTPIKNTDKVCGNLFSATSPICHPMCIVRGLVVVDIRRYLHEVDTGRGRRPYVSHGGPAFLHLSACPSEEGKSQFEKPRFRLYNLTFRKNSDG